MANDVGTPLSGERRRLTDERDRIEAQIAGDDERPRRWWRRPKSTARGTRMLLENRLRELEAEEAELSAPHELTPAADDRGIARDSLGR